MPNSPIISSVVADDHLFFREGRINVLKSKKRFEVVGIAGNGKELIELVTEHKPTLAIVDIGMPIMNGIEATKMIAGMDHKTAVIALSMHTEEAVIFKMLEAGAKGYLEKNISKEEMQINLVQQVVKTLTMNIEIIEPIKTSFMLMGVLLKKKIV